MRFKKPLLLALTVLAAHPVFSQSDDFGIWTSLGVDKKITKRFTVEAGAEFRSADNLNAVSRWSGSLATHYKLTDFLKIGAGYVFIYDHNPMESKVNYTNRGKVNGYNVDHGFWQNRHRAFFEMTGSLKAGRFKLSLRERYQYTHAVATDCKRTRFRDEAFEGYPHEVYPWNGTDFMEMEEGIDHKSGKDKHYLRSRAKVEYNIPKCPLNPFVSYELSNDLQDGLDLDKTRLIVGSEWKISKQHVISMGYLYQCATDGKHVGARHALDIGYKFSL